METEGGSAIGFGANDDEHDDDDGSVICETMAAVESDAALDNAGAETTDPVRRLEYDEQASDYATGFTPLNTSSSSSSSSSTVATALTPTGSTVGSPTVASGQHSSRKRRFESGGLGRGRSNAFREDDYDLMVLPAQVQPLPPPPLRRTSPSHPTPSIPDRSLSFAPGPRTISPSSFGENLSLLRRQVFVAESEVTAAVLRDESEDETSETMATCFGHWKAKVRAEVMLRGPKRTTPYLIVELRRKLELHGMDAGKRFIATRMSGRVQRKMADGVLMAWLTRLIFDHLRSLASATHVSQRNGELVGLKRALRWWSLWTHVRARNRSEDLLGRCEKYHRHRLLRRFLEAFDLNTAKRRLRRTSLSAAAGHARLRGLRGALRGLARNCALRSAHKAVASRVRTQRLRCVLAQVSTVRERSTSLQAKLLAEHSTRHQRRLMLGWNAWSSRRAAAHDMGGRLSAQELRRTKQRSLKKWYDTAVYTVRRRRAVGLLQQHVRGRLSRVAVRELRATEAREKADRFKDIFFVRWHGRHLQRQAFRAKEAAATLALQHVRARQVLKRLSQRISDSAVVSVAVEHYEETVEMRRSDMLRTWHAYTLQCAARHRHKRRQDAMIGRWQQQRAFVEISRAAMRERRDAAGQARSNANACRRGFTTWVGGMERAFLSLDRRARSAAHHQRRLLNGGLQTWLQRAARAADQRKRVEPFVRCHSQQRGFERLVAYWAGARRENRRRADAFAADWLASSGMQMLVENFDEVRQSNARLATADRHARAAALSRALEFLDENVRSRKEQRRRIAAATAFDRNVRMIPRSFQRFKRIAKRPQTRSAVKAHAQQNCLERGLADWSDMVDRRIFLRDAYQTLRARNKRFFVYLGVVRQWQRWVQDQARLARRALAVSDAVQRANRERTMERWRYLVFGEGQIILRALTLRDVTVENQKGMAWEAWQTLFEARRDGRAAVILQKAARRWLAQILLSISLEATVIIQCALRSSKARFLVDSGITAAETIQCWVRIVLARQECQDRRHSIVRVQGRMRAFLAYQNVIEGLSYQLPLDDVESLTAAYAEALEKLQSISNTIELWRGAAVVLGRFVMPPGLIMGAIVSRCHEWPSAVRHIFYTDSLPRRRRALRFFERVVGEVIQRLQRIELIAKAELFDRSACAIAHAHWRRRAQRLAVTTLRTKVLVRKAAAWCLHHTSWQPPLEECFAALVEEWQSGLRRDRRPGEIYHQRRIWTRWQRWVTKEQRLREHSAQLSESLETKAKVQSMQTWRRRVAKRIGADRLSKIWVRAWVRFQLREWWMAGKVYKWAMKSMRHILWRWLTAFYADRYRERCEAEEAGLRSVLNRWYRRGIEQSLRRARQRKVLVERRKAASRRSLKKWQVWAVSRRNKENPQKGGVWLALRVN